MAVDVRAFGVRFQEAIDFLKGKLPETTLTSRDLAGSVHSKVFSVAGGISVDLVSDIQASLVSGLSNGTTITQFRKDFDQAVQKHGWAYKGKRGWRTAVIFDNNMRSASMAGRWAQLQEGKDRRPYLQYRTAGDARVRPQHRQWNHKIFHIDDPFWQTHYPPNGWNCRCTVRAYSDRDIERKGLDISEPFEMKTRDVITRDGEITDVVPVGIDPGWDHNVGQAWQSPELALGQKMSRLPRQLQGLLAEKTITPAFQKVLTDNFKAFRTGVKELSSASDTAQVVGFLDGSTLNGLTRSAPDLNLESTAVAVLDRRVLQMDAARAGDSAVAWPEAWIGSLPEQLRSYRAVIWDTQEQMLIVIPTGSLPGTAATTLPRIAMRPNVASKSGPVVAVETLDAVEATNLTDASRYEVLMGRL